MVLPETEQLYYLPPEAATPLHTPHPSHCGPSSWKEERSGGQRVSFLGYNHFWGKMALFSTPLPMAFRPESSWGHQMGIMNINVAENTEGLTLEPGA